MACVIIVELSIVGPDFYSKSMIVGLLLQSFAEPIDAEILRFKRVSEKMESQINEATNTKLSTISNCYKIFLRCYVIGGFSCEILRQSMFLIDFEIFTNSVTSQNVRNNNISFGVINRLI